MDKRSKASIAEDTSRESYTQFFRQSSPYIHAHRGKTFVIMLPGEALESEHFSNIVSDIALLASFGVRLVLVHGARSQINSHLAKRNITTQFSRGYRLTDRESLVSVIEAVASQRVKLEGQLSMGLINSPMHGARIRVVSGNFVTARPFGVIDGIDFQHTGDIRRIDKQAITRLLDDGYIVLLSCLGYSSTGEVFNLLTEDVATHGAITLHAEKLILFAADEGLRSADGEIMPTMRPAEARACLNETELSPENRRLLSAALKACDSGILRTHIIGHGLDGTLLQELFTRQGCGTLITKDTHAYEHLRAATIDDVGGILSLIAPLEERGVLVHRPRKQLERDIHRFTVIVRDGMIIACASLNAYELDNCAELACLVVHPEYQKGDRGLLLLEHVEQELYRREIEQLFVLTTQTAHWFVERGFIEGGIEDLPDGKQKSYNHPRNSKIFIKSLSAVY